MCSYAKLVTFARMVDGKPVYEEGRLCSIKVERCPDPSKFRECECLKQDVPAKKAPAYVERR
nr:MAG TPA: hypothetical protein [Caudoviricetes sp.]